MSWQVWTSDKNVWKCVKSYPYRIQAAIWCYLNGYVINMGRHGQALNRRVMIVGVGKDGKNARRNK